MTEDEAKQMRCCGGCGCGAVADDGERYCIGAKCMGWRKIYKKNYKARQPPLPFPTAPEIELVDTKEGYCGLGGDQ